MPSDVDRYLAARAATATKGNTAMPMALGMGVGLVFKPGAPAFNGNFATLFPGAYLVLQADKGLTFGGTLKLTGTSTSVVTLSGSTPATPVPIMAKCTTAANIGSGAQFSIYYDGGTTPAMTSVTPAVATPVALTGAASGQSISWAAGSAILNDTWKATASALADQSGNGKNAIQATATKQPIVTPGYNGRVGLLFDGVDDLLISTITIPYPFQTLLVCRSVVKGAADGLCGGENPWQGSITGDATHYSQYAGSFANTVNNALTAQQRFAAIFTNSTADSLKVGSGALVTGANAGSAAGTKMAIGGFADGIRQANIEFLDMIVSAPTDYSAFDVALNSAAGYNTAAVLV